MNITKAVLSFLNCRYSCRILTVCEYAKKIKILVKRFHTIEQIKKIIFDKEGIPIYQQRIIFNNKVLIDSARLCDKEIGDDCTVILAFKSGRCGAIVRPTTISDGIIRQPIYCDLHHTVKSYSRKSMTSIDVIILNSNVYDMTKRPEGISSILNTKCISWQNLYNSYYHHDLYFRCENMTKEETCCICFVNYPNITYECGHKLCSICLDDILKSNGWYPTNCCCHLCRREIDIDKIIVMDVKK